MFIEGRPELKHPREYRGELLCPRCGRDPYGYYFLDCAYPGLPHDESCAKYEFAEQQCFVCQGELDA